MKRNRSALMGVSLTALAVMLIAVGCSSSNPVAPQTSGIQYENPQYTDRLPWGETDHSSVVVPEREDIRIELDKSTPDIMNFDRDNPPSSNATPIEDLRIE